MPLQGGAAEFEAMYRIGEEIGKGSFGRVYACCELGRPLKEKESALCVKVVPTSGRRRQESVGRTLLSVLQSLDHPNVIRMHHIMHSRDTVYILMDKCDGPELLDYDAGEVGNGMMDLETVQRLASQMLSALALVHSLRTMHRDVKPENFRFQDHKATTLKLLDFGSAKMSSGKRESHSVTGTLLYAAPEVFEGFYWYACDVWSVGVVLFLLISGQLPFESSDVNVLTSMHRDPILTGSCLLRGERWNQVPSDARALVRGLLSVDPAKRISASAALQHTWLTKEYGSSMSRAGSATSLRLCHSKSSLVDLKRTCFNWNLAGCGDEEPDAEPLGSPIGRDH